MKVKKTIIPLAFLLVITFGIRIWRISEAPASVNWDEAAVGYNAFSLLKTGRDEFGKAFPISLRSFDDYKPALYSYISVIPIALLGLGELSTRLTSAIAGTVLVFAVFYITGRLTANLKTAFIAAVFLAVSPWAIHFSRIAFESNLAVAVYYLAIAVFVYALRKPGAFGWSLGLFVLSMYAYHAQRAIALPTFLALIWIFKPKIPKTAWLTLLLLLPLVVSFFSEPAGSRLTSTIILKLWPFVPAGLPQLIYNPVLTLVWQIWGQFLAYFSPVNIFVTGSTEPILRIPTLGLLPLELLPFWLAGLVTVFKPRRTNTIVAILLILTPLPGVITWNWFSVVRTLALYPVFAIVAAAGYKFLRLPRILVFGFWTIFSLSALYTILTICIFAPYLTYGDFQPGFEKMVPYVMEESKKYDRVVVDTGQATPYIFFLFYGKYPPAQYLKEARRDLKHTQNYGYRFGKFIFRKIEDYELYDKNVLLVGQTYRLLDSEIEHIRKEREIKVTDFYDPGGYISLRVVEL
jgi:4-amino-4-deoxy-L-arabinose transferase-like glycosyltransferase